MPSALYDAHVHLASQKLLSARDRIFEDYQGIGLKKAIVVGTCPNDWDDAVNLCRKNDRCIPAVGLHPWKVNDAPDDWKAALRKHLDAGVSVLGEIGLDQWINGYDIERQKAAFIWQMEMAAERNLPSSIHCLRAHEPLLEVLKATALPERGFKIHAYNGPVATLEPLLELGAHFSFNGGQLKPNAKRVHTIIRHIPKERLLIETDAPDFLPTPECREFELNDTSLSHPANIRAAYAAIAEIRGCDFGELTATVEQNFQRYFSNAI